MEYHASNDGVLSSAASKTATNHKFAIICAAIILGIFILLGAIAIGLGVGLGVGLNLKTSSPTTNANTSNTCDANTARCGCPFVQPSISTRIVNGMTTISNSWPWMVAINFTNGRLCGGTLVTYQHILTAAHCVFDVNASDITVYGGIQRLSEKNNGQVRNVSNIVIHPNYNDNSKINDMAILKLTSPLNAGTSVGLCCLSTTTSIPSVGDYPVFIGWGRTASNSSFSDNLQQATVRVVNPSLCNYTSVTDNQICAGDTSSVACYGDSGSPLMTKINNLWTCIGVVNQGLWTCDSYVVYTRVSHYYSFISNAIAS